MFVMFSSLILLVLPLFGSVVSQEETTQAVEEEFQAAVADGEEEDQDDNPFDQFPLHKAVSENNVTRVLELLAMFTGDKLLAAMEEPADAANGMRPMHVGAYFGSSEAVEVLISAGAQVESWIDQGGMTALLLGAGQGHGQILHTLLKARADPSARDSDENTAMHYTAARGYLEAMEILAAARASLEVTTGKHKLTPLQMAAEQGEAIVVRSLCALRADMEAQGDANKFTALHLAAAMGHNDTLWELLDAGALLTAKDKQGRSPVNVAASFGASAMVLALISARANPESLGDDGSSALHMAAIEGHIEVAKVLIGSGSAHLELPDYSGRTPLDRAEEKGHLDVADAIREATHPGSQRGAQVEL